jgi:hypothetical protein
LSVTVDRSVIFSRYSVSSASKADDITEILLKVALNTIHITLTPFIKCTRRQKNDNSWTRRVRSKTVYLTSVDQWWVPGKNHRPIDSHWQTLSHNIMSGTFNMSEVYSMQHYLIKFVSDCRQVGGFLRVLQSPPPKNWPPRYNWNIDESGVKHHKPKTKLLNPNSFPHLIIINFVLWSFCQFDFSLKKNVTIKKKKNFLQIIHSNCISMTMKTSLNFGLELWC